MQIRTGSFQPYVDALMLTVCLTLLVSAPTAAPAQQQKETNTKAQASSHPQAADTSQAAASGQNAAAAATIVGRGTTNTIPLFTGSHTINNSLITQTGNGISVAGTVNAVAFTGNGSELTNVNASTLGGQGSSSFAQTGASNTFTADQTINGNLNLTGYINSTPRDETQPCAKRPRD